MKKFLVVLMLLSVAIMAFSVNAPRQPLLFYNISEATNLSQEVSNILDIAVLNDLDPETNVPNIATRFNYNFYSNSPIYAVEMSVMAAKFLGVEKEVLENYPLSAPTFQDIQTQLEESYSGKGYDFSRDFGYFEYVNSYMKKEIGYPLFDKDVKPLTQLTRNDVIKALVRLYAAKNKDKKLVEEAEELSKRFSANKDTGIKTPPDVGYISVFEKYFLTTEKDKLVPVIDSPLFTKYMDFQPNKTAPRWWAISLATLIYFSSPNNMPSNAMVPIRDFNNFVTYMPYDKTYHLFSLTSLPKMKEGTIESIKANVNEPSVFRVKMKSGKEIIGLDNTLITDNSTVLESGIPRFTSKVYTGKEFVEFFNSLPEKPSPSRNTTLTGKIEKKDVNYYFKPSKEDSEKYNIHKVLPIPKDAKIQVTEYDIKVGSVSDINKLYSSGQANNFTTQVKTMPFSAFEPKDIDVRLDVNISKTSSFLPTQQDFEDAEVMYYPVVDRLNLNRELATLKSIKKFNSKYSNGYKSIDSESPQYPLDFIDYWKNVEKSLDDLNVPSTSLVAARVIINRIKKLNPAMISVKNNVLNVLIWKVYVGKLVSFEPATHRIITQNFVDWFYYSPTAPVYITFKDGTTKKFKNMDEAAPWFYTPEHVLRNMVLWFQFEKNDEGKLVVTYIIAKELP
ncbi:hypothetical protein [Mesoaciditoga lauensis]|uniref:hypothetical protein n=1 Tax=Mesoaciditoga lauensis TaxID=1495039 RepID=UPI0005628DC5|nr:hypothetical protein [Mesoaciditoga lauensis]